MYFNKFARLNPVVLLKKTINLDDCKSIGTHWITPYVNGNNWRASMLTMPPTLTDLELNIFQKKKKKIIGNKNIIKNIYRMQAYDTIMCGYFCVEFIDFS